MGVVDFVVGVFGECYIGNGLGKVGLFVVCVVFVEVGK